MKTKTKTVPAKVYGLRICDGVTGYVHGQFTHIEEIYIPSLNAAFNMGMSGNDWCCFETTEEQRYQTKDPDDNLNGVFLHDIEIPKEIADRVAAYIDSRKEIGKVSKQLARLLKS